MKPKLSVVIPAFGGFHAVGAVVDAWESQTRRRDLEIVVFCPDGQGPGETERAALKPGQLVVDTGSALMHDARAMAIRRAAGEYIVFGEDHCLPDPDCAEALLRRIDEGWDVIGPALRLGNEHNWWTEAGFLLGNGEWMDPVAGGPVQTLSGLNVTVRARLLHDLGESLAHELTLPPYLTRRLGERGARFYVESRARMRHFEAPDFAGQAAVYWAVGAGFGLFRTRTWPRPARFLYLLAWPLVALLHWKRALVQYARLGAAAGLHPSVLAPALVLSCIWGVAEAAGACMPPAWAARQVWRDEVRPVRREDAVRSVEREGRRSPSRDTAGVARD
jgi:hypothetical protein